MDEDLLDALRSEAEAYGDVTTAIKADYPNINPDALAVYYRAKSSDDQVLMAGLEFQYGSENISRFDHYWNAQYPEEEQAEMTPDIPVDQPNKGENFFARTMTGATDITVDLAEAVPAGLASFSKSFTINTLENGGEKPLMAFNRAVHNIPALGAAAEFLQLTTVGVSVTPQSEAEIDALMAALPEYRHNRRSLGDVLEVGKRVRLHLNPDEVEAFNGLTGQEGLDALKTTLTEQEQRFHDQIDTAVGSFAAGMVEFGAAYMVTPGGGANVGRTAGIGLAALRGAVADNMVFDEGDANLSALATELGIPGADLFEFLATDQDDSVLEQRLKITIEGAGLGIAVDSLLPLLRGLRKAQRGEADADTVTQAVEEVRAVLQEATEARNLTIDEINGASKGLAEAATEEVADEALTAADLLVPQRLNLTKTDVTADQIMDTLTDLDVDDLSDQAIENLTGFRKFSEYNDWDQLVQVRAALGEHIDKVFEKARNSQTIDSMVAKAEAIRKRQLKTDGPEWGNTVIKNRGDAVQYLNNLMIERVVTKQVNEIGNWAADAQNGSPSALPPSLAHLKGLKLKHQEIAAAQLAERLVDMSLELGQRNQAQVSEAARTLAAHRWAKAGYVTEATAELEAWYKSKVDSGDPEWTAMGLGKRLARLVAPGDLKQGDLVRNLKAAGDVVGESASSFMRAANANLLANHKTLGINVVSEAAGHTEMAFLRSLSQAFKEYSQGNLGRGTQRMFQGTTFALRQFREAEKAWSNAADLYRTGIGEITGATGAFDLNIRSGSGRGFRQLITDSKNPVVNVLNTWQAGINRGIGAVSEFLSSMKIYTQTRDDAVMGLFGEKWQKLAKQRSLTREEITQMFIESGTPRILVDRTKSNNLIDAAYNDEAAFTGYRDDVRGFSDIAVGQFRRMAYKAEITKAAFDFFLPFARTISKITRKALLTSFPPLQFLSRSVWARMTSPNRNVRQLEYAKAASGMALYSVFWMRGFNSGEERTEERNARIAALEPGESVILFDPVDDNQATEDKQGWVRVTKLENGDLRETYFLPQELNMLFTTAIAAESSGRFWSEVFSGDPSREKGAEHFMGMAMVRAHFGSVLENNLIASAVQSAKSLVDIPFGEAKDDYDMMDRVDTWLALNAGRFTPLAPGIKHAMADIRKLTGDNPESMQFNPKLEDDRQAKFAENFAWGVAWRQLSRQNTYMFLNARRGPFGSPLPARGRGVGLIFKQSDVGEGEFWFADIMQNEFGVQVDRMTTKLKEGGLDFKEIRVAFDQRSLGDQMLERMGEIELDGMTIDQRFVFERDDPNSDWNNVIQREFEEALEFEVALHGGPMRPDGKTRTAKSLNEVRYDYLENIRRQYLSAAKEAVMRDMSDGLRAEVEERIAMTRSDYGFQKKTVGDFQTYAEGLR